MKDYRPLLSDVADFVENVLDAEEAHPRFWTLSYSRLEMQMLLDKINDMFVEVDNEFND